MVVNIFSKYLKICMGLIIIDIKVVVYCEVGGWVMVLGFFYICNVLFFKLGYRYRGVCSIII